MICHVLLPPQTFDCIALLARFVHSDVLMPLLLPSLHAFEQCDFFWKVTVRSPAGKNGRGGGGGTGNGGNDENFIAHTDADADEYASSSDARGETQQQAKQQQQKAMVADAVHSLGELSTGARLCVLLSVMRYAPPVWMLPYADCILGARVWISRVDWVCGEIQLHGRA